MSPREGTPPPRGPIELNADIGEGFDDATLLPQVDRASIACGGHVGDDASMRVALELCRRFGVAPGAHPSYPDRAGFGRRAMEFRPQEITRTVAHQVGALAACAADLGLALAHVKPHGALYLAAWRDPRVAAAVVSGVAAVDGRLAVLAPPGSALLAAAAANGLAQLREGFVDRAYLADGRLAPRDLSGALLGDFEAALARGLALARGEAIPTLDGAPLLLAVDSLCLHGDAPAAAALAAALRHALLAAGLRVGAATPLSAATPPRGGI